MKALQLIFAEQPFWKSAFSIRCFPPDLKMIHKDKTGFSTFRYGYYFVPYNVSSTFAETAIW